MTTPEREAFEAWFSDGSAHLKAVERQGDGYRLMSAHTAWGAWQAATEAARLARPQGALTDEQIDVVTQDQWGKFHPEAYYMTHRAYARAIESEVLARVAAERDARMPMPSPPIVLTSQEGAANMSKQHTPRPLTHEQMCVLKAAASATDARSGLRASYWPGARSLEKRGLVEKRGRSVHRLYLITEAGRAALAAQEGATNHG